MNFDISFNFMILIFSAAVPKRIVLVFKMNVLFEKDNAAISFTMNSPFYNVLRISKMFDIFLQIQLGKL